MKEKYVLITGGSSGIGLATAKIIAERGGKVVLVASNEQKLKNAIQELPGEEHFFYKYDLANLENICNIFDFISKKGIVLDGFVHCAGISPLCLLKDNSVELMQKVYSINVLSFIELTRFFYSERVSCIGARIVVVTSTTAHASGYRQILYGSSKAALVATTKLMAKELLNRNIRVNCISPAVVDTPLLDELREKSAGLNDKIKQTQLLGIIPPSNIGNEIVYLLQDGSDYRTGEEIFIQGGFLS